MKVFGVAGWSGSGKTTLVIRLIPALISRGVTVSTMKHAHHGFDVDRPGKDSYEHRQAGATEVMVTSGRRWALMRDLRGEAEPSLAELMSRMTPVDLLLIEGFKRQSHDKLEVHRPALGKPLLCHEDERIVAVASDAPIAEFAGRAIALPRLDLNDVDAIAAFILRHSSLGAGTQGVA
ncbi:MAG: molybdopterin-guanine dinucleotide biosynthesis protein B [Rhodospirillales bacterium]|nr:molybdopterin-guanine dinucleotide biosynthesis protein B [Rhodospirillales bacterium]